MDLLGACTGIVLPVFFAVKRIRENKMREGLFQISTWQLQKRKGKLISYNVLCKMILINP
jgi:hypothetical protein